MILIENGPGGRAAGFLAPRTTVVAWSPDGIGPALAALDAARAQGAWVAGIAAFEAGYALEPQLLPLIPADRPGPLLAFGLYDGPVAPPDLPGTAGLALTQPEPVVTREAYGRAFARVAGYIAAGDCYQVNLTFPMAARLSGGDAFALYARLQARGPVRHGGYVDLGAGPAVVSRSPELFFRVDPGGRIAARPMKGTAPRHPDPDQDRRLAEELQASAKARAENLMIVDLLRNDIGRIARVGSVQVPELFAVESFTTVHQMSSTVTGVLAGAPGMAGLMAALFPCGSVTGAPKIRAMEIIRALEPHPRGAYCGAMGWMAPDGTAAFAVTIRTLSVFPGGAVTLNVGGGVVADSTAEGEWEEALWKARFAKGF